MNTVRIITVSVEYNDADETEITAVNALASQFEEVIAQANLSLDNIEEEIL